MIVVIIFIVIVIVIVAAIAIRIDIVTIFVLVVVIGIVIIIIIVIVIVVVIVIRAGRAGVTAGPHGEKLARKRFEDASMIRFLAILCNFGYIGSIFGPLTCHLCTIHLWITWRPLLRKCSADSTFSPSLRQLTER